LSKSAQVIENAWVDTCSCAENKAQECVTY
jgi:hypothetical protein